MLKVLLHGCLGQMGQTLQSLIKTQDDIQWIGFDTSVSQESNIYNNYKDLPPVDVIIDFSHFSLIDDLLKYSVKKALPLVLCTTGLSDETEDLIRESKEQIAIFQSQNMSLGIHALLEMARIGAEILDNYDIEIIEKHHNKKIDAPSGTAKMILNSVKEVKEELSAVYGRHGNDALRKKNDIGIHAIRGGNITGEHSLLFAGLDEVIEIKHQATSKIVFAQGAIAAARYLYKQRPGIYSMSDLFRKD